MPIAEKIPSSPDQGNACVGKRRVLCIVTCRDKSGPVQHVTQHVTRHVTRHVARHVTQHVTRHVTYSQTASLQVLTDCAYTTTPHHTSFHLPSAAASRHECSLPHACTSIMASADAYHVMTVVLHSCADCAAMQVPCLRAHSFSVDSLCNTFVSCFLVLHIVFCPMQLSFLLQMAAAWSRGAVARRACQQPGQRHNAPLSVFCPLAI